MVNQVSILGCGWYGTALAAQLVKSGYNVMGSATSPEKIELLHQRGITGAVVKLDSDPERLNPTSSFWDCDALIIASNVKLGANPDYFSGMENLVDLVKSKQVKKVIFISSTSVYGDHNGVIDETTACDPETPSGAVLLKLESLFQGLSGIQSTALRFGGLVGPGRLPGSFFAGKQGISNGLAPVNLIHMDDCLGVTALLLQLGKMPLKVNAVSPDHPSRVEFYSLAAAQQRLEVPQFISERLNWKIVKSSFLENSGYEFQIRDWKCWLLSL